MEVPFTDPKDQNHIKVVGASPACEAARFPMTLAVCCGTLLACVNVGAQQVEVARYDVDDGLPQSMVNHVVQDSDGFIWLGTGDGLARFDGARYVVYKHDPRDSTSLSNNAIWGVAEADAQHLWVGTRTGLDRLDRRTGRFTHLRSGLPEAIDGCWRPVRITRGEACFYSPLNMRYLRIDARGIRCEPSGHGPTYVLRRLADGTLLTFVPRDSLVHYDAAEHPIGTASLPVAKGEEVTDMLPLDTDLLVLTTLDVFLFRTGGQRLQPPAATRAWMCSAPARKFAARDADGNVWVAVNDRGLAMLTKDLRIAQVYPLLPAGEGPLVFTGITFDRQGNVWVSTDGKGVFRIAPRSIKFGRIMPGIHHGYEPRSWFVRRFAQWDSTHVLISFYHGGFTCFDERTGELEDLPLEGVPPTTDVRQLVVDGSGTLWMVADSVLLAYRVPARTPALRLHCDYGTALLLNAQERTLLIDMKGAHRWDHATARFEPLPYPGLGAHIDSLRNVPRTILYDDQGRIWTVPIKGALAIWSATGRIPLRPVDQALFNSGVQLTGIMPNGAGGYWTTSNAGLFEWDKNLHVVRSLTIHEGAPDQYLYGMLPGAQGHDLWISSNNGLARFDPHEHRFTDYGRRDGLQSKEFNLRALFRSRSGTLYFGGVNGVNLFDPARIQSDTDRALVRLVRIVRDDQPVDPGTRSLELRYARNRLELEFAVLEFTTPERNTFRYRMPGYIDEWRTSMPTTPLVLERIPAGEYTLEVEGVNGDGIASPVERILTVHVPLPFWASRWALVFAGSLLASFAGLTIFLVYRSRMRARQRKAEVELKELRVRTRLAKDIHDDVGSGLARIAALTRSTVGSNDPVRLEKVSAISTELLANLRDVVWMNDPRHDDLAAMLLRVKDHAIDLLEPIGVQVHAALPDPLPHRAIDGTTRHHVFLIAKEALHNVAKYAGARNVTLRATLLDEVLSLEISDDGHGFQAEPQREGNGLRNMRQRAEAISGNLTIGASPEGGVRVHLTCPLPPNP